MKNLILILSVLALIGCKQSDPVSPSTDTKKDTGTNPITVTYADYVPSTTGGYGKIKWEIRNISTYQVDSVFYYIKATGSTGTIISTVQIGDMQPAASVIASVDENREIEVNWMGK
jgi:hypothetical protein